MKKHLLIGTTIVALVLSFGLLFFGVYAALTQGFSINNKIHFAGGQNVKFLLKGQITGTVNDYDDQLKFNGDEGWQYDYDDPEHDTPNVTWNIPDLMMKSEGLEKDDIHLTYTFTIQNQGECAIVASFDGPGDLANGLIKNTYVQTGAAQETAGTSVQIGLASTATLKLKLTVEDINGFAGKELIAFSIIINAVTD